MTYERFDVIKRYFHVFDNDLYSDTNSDTIKMSKLDGLIGFLNKKFHQIYEPERDLPVDGNMCSWSGKGGSKVYMPLKPIKYGIKLYAMCESKSGYACSIIQYNSKNSESNVEMLKRLTTNYTNKSIICIWIIFIRARRCLKACLT
ncbi:PiggyBac transposable element-derived protein 4 [Dictyocoela muelleri]|nr:PiggyBac transposable element-derived protein 4 [Dictyocoela muelleri]